MVVAFYGGEGEIRTRGELPHACFQDKYLQPLGHLSRWVDSAYFNRCGAISREVVGQLPRPLHFGRQNQGAVEPPDARLLLS